LIASWSKERKKKAGNPLLEREKEIERQRNRIVHFRACDLIFSEFPSVVEIGRSRDESAATITIACRRGEANEDTAWVSCVSSVRARYATRLGAEVRARARELFFPRRLHVSPSTRTTSACNRWRVASFIGIPARESQGKQRGEGGWGKGGRPAQRYHPSTVEIIRGETTRSDRLFLSSVLNMRVMTIHVNGCADGDFSRRGCTIDDVDEWQQ